MRTSVLLVALLAGLIPLDQAVGQKSCEASCSGNAGCVQRCASAAKRASQAKQRHAAPKAAPTSSSDSGNAWRERAFTNDGGGGGY